MGQDKALLKRDGRSQLASLVALLEPMVERVFVSTRSDQREESERRRFAQIIDNYSDIGPVAGVLSAMEEHPAVDWLVVACDLPNVSEDTIALPKSHLRLIDRATTIFRSPCARFIVWGARQSCVTSLTPG